MTWSSFCRRGAAILVFCLLAPPRAEAAGRVELELITEPGFPVNGAPQVAGGARRRTVQLRADPVG